MAELPRPVRVLGDLLAVQAEMRPDAEALTDGAIHLSWRQYHDTAEELAAVLAAHGVQPGDRVGVHLPKSTASFVAVHAILRLAAVVVPVDWFAPSAYVGDVLTDAGARVVVTAHGRLGALVDDGTIEAAIAPPDAESSDPHRPTLPKQPAPDPRADAYIVYTSGSTGRPKGIVHTHASALAYAELAVATYGLSADDRLANVAPLHFDQSTFELYAAALVGAAVLVLSDTALRFPASVGELIERERITVWYSVPFAITQLVERGALEDRDLGRLRWVLFGGESFATTNLAAAQRALAGARFSNVYGPAEVNQCTFHHLDATVTDDGPIPIGRPWDGAEVLVVDGDGRDVGHEQSGELLVAATTMMDRYWGRPDLTVAAIESRDGRRWYRTGDLVRRLPDDSLVFVGRADHQVKVRGHRVELEAVELVLADHPAVQRCAVVVHDDHLVALVVPPPDDGTKQALTSILRRRLPRYAVPTIVGMDDLPETGTGKVDRRAAAARLSTDASRPTHPTEGAAPKS